ncbi:MAG: hypothetical protein LBT86_03190 [Deltaproteobacteria bacterium]|jgi:hypothetical protein|nr:hypothetical protein [Deltaproteobacteria bacterium]
MTSTNESGGFNQLQALRRLLLRLEVWGYGPEESLSLVEAIWARQPTSLAEALNLLRNWPAVRPAASYPPHQPPLNRRSMITDELSNGDFFNDLEL